MANNLKNHTVKWRLIMAIITGILIPIVAWGFMQIRDLPVNYCTRAEVKEVKQDINKRLDRIEDKIDKLLWRRP